MIEIIPGILEKDFAEIEKKIALVEDLVDWVHIDILDDTLIHNATYNNWEPFKIFSGRVYLEAHLMVQNPQQYVNSLVSVGFKRLIAQVESNDFRHFMEEAKIHEVEVGVALDGSSQLELIEPFLGEIDYALVMMYKAGQSGQSFQSEQLPKIRKIHEEYQNLPIEVDGGIDKDTAPLVITSGATRLVSTSYLFWKNADRIAEAIEELKTGIAIQ